MRINCFREKALPAILLCLFLIGNNSPTRARGSNRADVLLGPCSWPAAQGPTGFDDDFTNLAINGRLAVATGGVTNAPGSAIFKNSVQNMGPDDDVFNLSVASVPSGLSVEISTDFGEHYKMLNSPLDRSATISVANVASEGACAPVLDYVAVPLAYRTSATFLVRITARAGLRTLTAFDTILRATSTRDPAVTNDTIDRLYTGFVQLEMTARPINRSAPSDMVNAPPGTEIEFVITYRNISSASGVGSSLLTGYDIVIKVDGNAAPNNWGTTTEHIVGASDNQGGYISGDREGSTCLSSQVMILEAGKSGVFKFRRRIR